MESGATDEVRALAFADVVRPVIGVGPPLIRFESICSEEPMLDLDLHRSAIRSRDGSMAEYLPSLIRDNRPQFSSIPTNGDGALGPVVLVGVEEEPDSVRDFCCRFAT